MRVNLNLYENSYRRQVVPRSDISFGIAATLPARPVVSRNISFTIGGIAYKLGLDKPYISSLLKDKSDKSIQLLERLASRYEHARQNNLYSMDTPDMVINLFNEVNKPNAIHYQIINHYAGSVEVLRKMFRLINSNKILESINKFKSNIIKHHEYNSLLIPNLLESPNRNEYLKHTDKYASYFKLNLNNPDAVSNLDKMISEGKYVQKQYDSQYYLGRLFKNIPAIRSQFGGVFKESILGEYFSKEGSDFLSRFFTRYIPGVLIPKKNYIDLARIYTTTSEKNIELRLDVLKKFKLQSDKIEQDPKIMQSEITAMRELFDKIDNNTYARKFVQRAISKNLKVNSIEELLDIMDKVSAKKAYVFYKNLSRLIAGSKPQEQADAIEKGLMQPFYETTHMKQHRSRREKYQYIDSANRPGPRKYISNIINIIRYKFTHAETPYTSEQSLAETRKLRQNINNSGSKKLILMPNSKEVVKRIRFAKREEAIQEVNDIISRKLGKKTLEFQQGEYVKELTKIRLKLLPEMFESVKDIRAFYSANKIKSDLKNADVVELYSKINGNNRKLVNYMLKIRDNNGNRLFSVCDIVELINKSNSILKAKKQSNHNMKAADVKAYYNHIFDSYVSEYGKVKRVRKNVSQKSSIKQMKLRKAS